MKLFKKISRAQLDVLAVLLNIIIVTSGLAIYALDTYPPGLASAIGSGMVASGLAALILTVYQIASNSVTENEEDLHRVAKVMGLRKVHTRRPDFRMDGENDHLSGARIVEVLAITAHSLFPNIDRGEWAEKCPKAIVRVLLLHPFYPPGSWSFANQRDLEEEHWIGTDAMQINDFVRKFGVISKFKGGGSFELRLARRMPTLSYFRIDDHIYWAPYLARTYGPSTPHIEIERGGVFFEVLEQHFERLWKGEAGQPMPLPADDLDALARKWREHSQPSLQQKPTQSSPEEESGESSTETGGQS
jgi:hypothetical protein